MKILSHIKSWRKGVALVPFLLVAAGCAPSGTQLREAIEKDPGIVFVAIQKDPDQFIEVVNRAAKSSQESKIRAQAEEEKNRRDEEFKNPLKPMIEKGRASLGSENAPITIVEYSDFECPYCARGYLTLKEVEHEYPGQFFIVFKHMPLDIHPKAMPAAKYFEAIARQSADKAYAWHDMVFENQNNLRSQGEAFMKEAAKKVGVNMDKLNKDLKDPKLAERIEADSEEAQKFGFTGTPGFVINGVALKGAYPISEFKVIIDRHLKSKM